MNEVEKSYIAGIIDGEGSILLEKFHKNQLPSPAVSIASTSLELLQWIKDTFGKGTIKRKKNYNKDLHKDCYTYLLRYNDALIFIEEIYPYLIINTKRKRAQLLLDDYKRLTPRNGRYSEEILDLKLKFYNEFLSIK